MEKWVGDVFEAPPVTEHEDNIERQPFLINMGRHCFSCFARLKETLDHT